MIPFPCKPKFLSSLEHGILASEMPVLIGPGEMIFSTELGLELRDGRPPSIQEIRIGPEVEERFPAKAGKLCHNGDPIGRRSRLFKQRLVNGQTETPLSTLHLAGHY